MACTRIAVPVLLVLHARGNLGIQRRPQNISVNTTPLIPRKIARDIKRNLVFIIVLIIKLTLTELGPRNVHIERLIQRDLPLHPVSGNVPILRQRDCPVKNVARAYLAMEDLLRLMTLRICAISSRVIAVTVDVLGKSFISNISFPLYKADRLILGTYVSPVRSVITVKEEERLNNG